MMSIGDGYLEHGLQMPITSRPLWIALRSGALLSAGIVISLLPDTQHRTAVMLVLFLAAALQPLLPLLLRKANTGAFQAASDFVVIAAIVFCAPSLWSASMVWLGATIA